MSQIDGVSRRDILATALALPTTASATSALPVAAQPASATAKTLVACFSRTGNTRVIANQIRRAKNSDLFEIEPEQAYPEDYEATVRQAQRERSAGFRPALKASVPNLNNYDTVFLGFPIWGTSAPAVIRSFLSAHDLSGKMLVPFITHGGYGRGDALAVVAAHAPRARLIDGFLLKADQERETLAGVIRWLGEVRAGR